MSLFYNKKVIIKKCVHEERTKKAKSLKVTTTISINYAEYQQYSVSVDARARESLGLEGDPVINGNRLELTCTKTGSGRITLSSSVGKDSSREDGISGLDFSREISIVSRSFAAENGGWL